MPTREEQEAIVSVLHSFGHVTDDGGFILSFFILKSIILEY